MNQQIQCPKCGSTQISAQKRGFSGGKAIGGAVVAGGVGALAGLHGSNDLENHCMKCGYSWKPANQYKMDSEQRMQTEFVDEQKVTKQFYADYESGQFEYARRNIPQSAKVIFEKQGLDAAYKYMKSLDKSSERFKSLLLGGGLVIILIIVIFFARSCN